MFANHVWALALFQSCILLAIASTSTTWLLNLLNSCACLMRSTSGEEKDILLTFITEYNASHVMPLLQVGFPAKG